MAKQPEVTRLCRIHADASLDQVGHVLAALTEMNLGNIGYELVTEVATFNRKQTREISGEAYAAEWLKDHPTFQISELTAHFKADGRTPTGAYYAVKVLLEKKQIKKLSSGNYQRADVKAIAAPVREHYAVGNRELIWQVIGKRKKFAAADLTEAFKKEGRPTGSMTSVLNKLLLRKEVKRIGEGLYEVVGRKLGVPAPAKKRPANPVSRYDISNKDIVLQKIKGRTKVTVHDMEGIFASMKRNPRSVSAIFTLLSKGSDPTLTRDVSTPGLYLVNKKTKPETASTVNGSGQEVSEASHG